MKKILAALLGLMILAIAAGYKVVKGLEDMFEFEIEEEDEDEDI